MVATVARTYRMAIDDYFENPDKYRENNSKIQKTEFHSVLTDSTQQDFSLESLMRQHRYMSK